MIFLLHLFNQTPSTSQILMNLKLHPFYVVSFLMLVFLVQEIHDWSHLLAVRATCHCWPVRLFGDWLICGTPSAGQHALISVAGPLVNVVLFLTGYSLLNPENSTEENSVGIALV